MSLIFNSAKIKNITTNDLDILVTDYGRVFLKPGEERWVKNGGCLKFGMAYGLIEIVALSEAVLAKPPKFRSIDEDWLS